MTVTAAGVLVYAVHRDDVLFLLGQEPFSQGWGDSDTWKDFGGRREIGETIEECASREFYEETQGVVCSQKEMLRILQNNHYIRFFDTPISRGVYRCFVVRIPYADYPVFFDRAREFLRYVRADITSVENSGLRWFSYGMISDLINQQDITKRWKYQYKPRLRPKFIETMRSILECLTFFDLYNHPKKKTE